MTRLMDYKGRIVRTKTHRRYSDAEGREDLQSLALCSHMKGPHDVAYLTAKAEEVTCGRCLRIMRGRS
jgi:hypothetical protein